MDTCHLLLAEGWSQWPLQSLTFNLPWNKFEVESKNEVLNSLGKLEEQISDRYFRRRFYEPISCILYVEKYQNHEQWHLLLVTSSNLSAKMRCFMDPPSPKSHIAWPPPPLLGGVSSGDVFMLAAWLKSSFCTQIKLNLQFSGYAFFFSVGYIRSLILCDFFTKLQVWKEIIYQNCINLWFTCKKKTGKTGRHPKRTAWGAEEWFWYD